MKLIYAASELAAIIADDPEEIETIAAALTALVAASKPDDQQARVAARLYWELSQPAPQ